jgi:hypothetical protein
MFNPKIESRNKKVTKSLPKYYVFFVFYCFCALKYHAHNHNFLKGRPKGGRESFKNGRGFWRMWP